MAQPSTHAGGAAAPRQGSIGRLGPAARTRLALEIARSYRIVRKDLRARELREVLASARARGAARPSSLADLPPERLGNAVSRTLSVLPGDTRCLTRSVVLCELLARRGHQGTLVIGVTSGKPEFEAHAWVEHDGRAVLPEGDGRFGRLTEL